MSPNPDQGLVLLVERASHGATDHSPTADALRSVGLVVRHHVDPARALGAMPEAGRVLVVVDAALVAGPNLVWLAVFAEIGTGPVLLLADEGDPHAVGRALRAGADDFLFRSDVIDHPERAKRLIAHALARYELRGAAEDGEQASPPDAFFAPQGRPAIRRDPLEGYITEAVQEFCTPLTVVREFAAILAEGLGGELTDKQAEYLGYIESASSDLLEMFDAFRDAIRLRCQALPYQPEERDVQDIFERALGRARARLDAKSLVVSCTVGDGAGRIHADESHMEHVIAAMLRRAARVTPRGGTVRLWSRTAPGGTIEIGVTDEGPRPTSSDVAILRDGSFADAIHRRSVTRVFGVDMELARSLARIGGGALCLAQAVGGGATMSLRLQAAPAAARPAHRVPASMSTEKSLRRYTHSPDSPSHT